jgi:hypothetical protein
LCNVDLARFEHGARDSRDVFQVGGAVIQRCHPRAAAHRLERMTTAARAEIEQPISTHERKPLKVDR